MPTPGEIVEREGLRLFSPAAALTYAAPVFFTQKPVDARTALALFSDASEILAKLLEGGHSVIAGRLAGAFRNIGRNRIADEMVKNVETTGAPLAKAIRSKHGSTSLCPPRDFTPMPAASA